MALEVHDFRPNFLILSGRKLKSPKLTWFVSRRLIVAVKLGLYLVLLQLLRYLTVGNACLLSFKR